MRKFILLLLLAIIWKIYVFSGDHGRLVYTSKEQPRFDMQGRWLHFRDIDGDEIDISGSSTIVIRKTEK